VDTARVDAILSRTRGPEVLDIGCSGQEGRRGDFHAGDFLHYRLSKEYPNLLGLEYSPENVEAMKLAGFENVLCGDAQGFDLDRKFNTIVAGELIEHLANPGLFLEQCLRHLGTDGSLIITTPYVFSIAFALYAWLKYPKTCSNDEHQMWYCPTTLQQIAESNGFRVQELFLIAEFRSDVPSRTGRIVHALARVSRPLLPRRFIANTMLVVLMPA
jgi:2-polyprenyl-3-methyl-5-hydroxy-6-metoxy-1,4-benzoquinol methylase